MNDVDNFIRRFQEKNSNTETIFGNDCSYWFANILYHRFIRNGAKIMYSPTTNRFCTMVCNKLYDISGTVDKDCYWIPWLSITDKELKARITNKYIMF